MVEANSVINRLLETVARLNRHGSFVRISDVQLDLSNENPHNPVRMRPTDVGTVGSVVAAPGNVAVILLTESSHTADHDGFCVVDAQTSSLVAADGSG